MKPTVIESNASASATAGNGGPANVSTSTSTNGVKIPIAHEFSGQQMPYRNIDPNATAYGSPHQHQYQQPQPQQQQHHPSQFQDFGFDPSMDIDMDMFPRSRLGRMHDPFAGFGGTRKRSSLHDPHNFANDGFSRYFDDDADFGFPQFGSLGRRRPAAGTADPMTNDHDFFNRLPSEFRQYIPEGFGNRRAGPGGIPQQPPVGVPTGPTQHYQSYVQPGTPPTNIGPQQTTTSKRLCDAAIQTEDPPERSEVDNAHPIHIDNLNQHGLRNTVDMGVKSAPENESQGQRSHSVPPHTQQSQQSQQTTTTTQRPVPPTQGARTQFSTQTSNTGFGQPQQPQFQKTYYAPQQQSHPQQKQQTPPPPQTPGGSYVRTIPIFVEGRSEPIINSHKEIPNQNVSSAANANAASSSASASASAKAFTPQQPQPQSQQQSQQQQYYQQQSQPQSHQHRPPPFNTQQANTQQPEQTNEQQTAGAPPQTPHTLDSINKIQDIQRDVLELMGKVEKFTGTREDKEYGYLDEMLTRNLLKLDTIDTNGKESIRLARKEAIKCIQASINVLEAKAEQNARAARGNDSGMESESLASPDNNEAASTETTDEKPDNSTNNQMNKNQEPIPLPPPESMDVDVQKSESQKTTTSEHATDTVVNNENSKTSNTTNTIETKG